MNTISVTLDFPKLIVSSGQIDIREDVNQRISVIDNSQVLTLILIKQWMAGD